MEVLATHASFLVFTDIMGNDNNEFSHKITL